MDFKCKTCRGQCGAHAVNVHDNVQRWLECGLCNGTGYDLEAMANIINRQADMLVHLLQEPEHVKE